MWSVQPCQPKVRLLPLQLPEQPLRPHLRAHLCQRVHQQQHPVAPKGLPALRASAAIGHHDAQSAVSYPGAAFFILRVGLAWACDNSLIEA